MNMHGAAIIHASDARLADIAVVASEPPPRQAAIRNRALIAEDPDLQKACQKEQAMKLAQAEKKFLLR